MGHFEGLVIKGNFVYTVNAQLTNFFPALATYEFASLKSTKYKSACDRHIWFMHLNP